MVGRVPKFATLAAWLVACAVLAAPAHAYADRLSLQGHIDGFWATISLQDRSDLGNRIFGRRAQRGEVSVARFTSQGGPSFVLDQSGLRPLLRYDGSNEIWVLRASAGLRGDVYFRNDVGEVVLRATRLGGLTLYTASAPGGLPCAATETSGRLQIARHDVQTLFRHMLREATRGGQAIRGQLEIRARDVEPQTDDIYGDAATVAIDGIVRLSQARGGRERLQGLRILSIVEGSGPDARREGDTLVVTLAPRLGPAGRPSSARVMRALG